MESFKFLLHISYNLYNSSHSILYSYLSIFSQIMQYLKKMKSWTTFVSNIARVLNVISNVFKR